MPPAAHLQNAFNTQRQRQQLLQLYHASSASELYDPPPRCRIDSRHPHTSSDPTVLSSGQIRWRRTLVGLAMDRSFLSVVLIRFGMMAALCFDWKVI